MRDTNRIFVQGQTPITGAKFGWILQTFDSLQGGYLYLKLECLIHSGIYEWYHDWFYRRRRNSLSKNYYPTIVSGVGIHLGLIVGLKYFFMIFVIISCVIFVAEIGSQIMYSITDAYLQCTRQSCFSRITKVQPFSHREKRAFSSWQTMRLSPLLFPMVKMRVPTNFKSV